MTDTMTPAALAAAVYTARVAEIRATIPADSRAFAHAMTDASAEYERAMVADIGKRAARRKGAGISRRASKNGGR